MERALSVMMTCRLNGWSSFTILRDGLRHILTGTPQELSQYDELRMSSESSGDPLNER